MMSKDKSTIELKDTDCALIIRENGSTECYIPDTDDRTIVGLHSIVIAALSIKVQDKDFVDEMIQFMENEQTELAKSWIH